MIEPSESPYYPDTFAVLIFTCGRWCFLDRFGDRENAENLVRELLR